MDIKDLQAHKQAEKEERESLSSFVRIFMDIKEFIYYKIMSRILNIKTEFNLFVQKLKKGYNDEDIHYLNHFIIEKIHSPIKEFVNRYSEQGMSLPKDFETDPAAWLVILRKIENSVDHAWRNIHDKDYYPTKNMGIEEKEKFYKDIDEGFMLLGKYLRDLWD